MSRTPTYDAFSHGAEEALHRLADGDDPKLVEAYARGVRAMAGRVRDRVANGEGLDSVIRDELERVGRMRAEVVS